MIQPSAHELVAQTEEVLGIDARIAVKYVVLKLGKSSELIRYQREYLKHS